MHRHALSLTNKWHWCIHFSFSDLSIEPLWVLDPGGLWSTGGALSSWTFKTVNLSFSPSLQAESYYSHILPSSACKHLESGGWSMTQVHSLELSKGAVVVSTGLSTVPVHCAPQGLSSCTWCSWAHMALMSSPFPCLSGDLLNWEWYVTLEVTSCFSWDKRLSKILVFIPSSLASVFAVYGAISNFPKGTESSHWSSQPFPCRGGKVQAREICKRT